MMPVNRDELTWMLERAAEMGAKKALAKVGLHDEDAAQDMREVRDLLDAWRDARRVAWKTAVRFVTMALLTGAAAALGWKHLVGGE